MHVWHACVCVHRAWGGGWRADYRGPKWLGRASDADVHTYHSTVSVSVLTRPRHLKHRDTWEAKYRECNGHARSKTNACTCHMAAQTQQFGTRHVAFSRNKTRTLHESNLVQIACVDKWCVSTRLGSNTCGVAPCGADTGQCTRSVLPPCWPATSIPNAVCAVKVGCTPWYRRRRKRFAPLGPTCRPASLTGLLLAAFARWQSALGRRRRWWWSESIGSRGYSR